MVKVKSFLWLAVSVWSHQKHRQVNCCVSTPSRSEGRKSNVQLAIVSTRSATQPKLNLLAGHLNPYTPDSSSEIQDTHAHLSESSCACTSVSDCAVGPDAEAFLCDAQPHDIVQRYDGRQLRESHTIFGTRGGAQIYIDRSINKSTSTEQLHTILP